LTPKTELSTRGLRGESGSSEIETQSTSPFAPPVGEPFQCTEG
jgi:hypothetical protein